MKLKSGTCNTKRGNPTVRAALQRPWPSILPCILHTPPATPRLTGLGSPRQGFGISVPRHPSEGPPCPLKSPPASLKFVLVENSWTFGQCLYNPDMKNKTQNHVPKPFPKEPLASCLKLKGTKGRRLGSPVRPVPRWSRQPTFNCHRYCKFTSLGVSRWPPAVIHSLPASLKPLGFLSAV